MIDGVIIDFAGSGDFLLEVGILLHDGGDFLVSLEFWVFLEGDVDLLVDVLKSGLEFVTGNIWIDASAGFGDVGESIFI